MCGLRVRHPLGHSKHGQLEASCRGNVAVGERSNMGTRGSVIGRTRSYMVSQGVSQASLKEGVPAQNTLSHAAVLMHDLVVLFE